jgi:sulfite exporter TauE/SafE
MCGGLVTGICASRLQWIGYQIGRLVSYALLGAIAGRAGQAILGSGAVHFGTWIATVAMAVAFVAMGAQVWRGRAPHFKVIPQAWVSRAYRFAHGAPFLLGALSAALPCGWLQSFVLASAATRSPLAGALLMATFWAGTLPALAATPWLARTVARPLSRRAPRLAAILLILVGVGGLGVKAFGLHPVEAGHDHGNAGKPQCHCHCE